MLHHTLALALALAGAALAQSGANPFNVPTGGYAGVAAGKTLQLSWKPTTGGTVTLVLRSGDAADLMQGTVIAANAPNSGSYSWSVPSSITKGGDYAVEIVADGDSGETNFTPQFGIDSSNTTPSSTSIVSLGATSTSLSSAASSSMPSSSSSSMSSSSSASSSSSSSMSMTTSTSMSSSSSASASSTSGPTAAATASASSAAGPTAAAGRAGSWGAAALGAVVALAL